PTWTDSHCHLHDESIPGGTDAAIAAADEAGVTTMITVGCDRATTLAAIEVATRFDGVHATAGLHPHEARFGVDTVADLVAHPAVVAVGEAGLDFHYDHSPRDAQRRAFAEQIQLAHQHDLPLVIHTREAWDDTFDILRAEGAPERTVFHCFTGGPAELARCLDLGAYVSFSGIASFPSADDVRAAAARCPLDRLLVETDSPYLAPVPHRGRRNQPAWVVDVGNAIATLRGTSATEIAAATTANARLAFPAIAS
ncbi:MAG: TatD family hydrolase, partial [Ilumatobacteraceae bacterium]|nr:TatD family hydrolase [Ilumatobacteraceae bacterium]